MPLAVVRVDGGLPSCACCGGKGRREVVQQPRVRVLAGSGPAPARGQRRAGRRMATAARPAAATAISTAPATLLDQYIESAMECFWLRTGPAMISQTPSSTLASCRPGNPRGLARANTPTPATASPEIRLTVVALLPVF